MRNVNLRFRGKAQTDQVHVRDHANNFAYRGITWIDRSIRGDAFTDWIFAGKKLFRETLRHNRNRRRVPIIAIGESATMSNRNADGSEVIGGDDVDFCDRLLPCRDGMLFDIEVAFLYPWAMALRDLGWPGFVQVVLFMVLLLAGYVYVWRKGALDWGSES